MCGRFTLTLHEIEPLAEELGATIDPALREQYRARYNVAPGDHHWILRSKEARRHILPADWGLINSWATDPRIAFKQINARAETLEERPAFRDAFQRRRCVVLADGFYEWTGPRSERTPVWFHAPDRAPLLFAGLYERWTAPTTGEVKRTFTIVTTEANEIVAPVHDRMPAVIPRDALEQWLTGPRPQELLRPLARGLLLADPASPRLNRAVSADGTPVDDPALLDPDDQRVRRQLSLF